MDNLEPGTVWKHIALPGEMLVIIDQVDENEVKCVTTTNSGETMIFDKEKFLSDYQYHLPEYKAPYDVGTEYI